MVGDLESITSAAQAALPPGDVLSAQITDATPSPSAASAPRPEPWPTAKISLGYAGWASLFSAVHGNPNQVELVLMHEGRSVGSLRVSCGWIDDPEKPLEKR